MFKFLFVVRDRSQVVSFAVTVDKRMLPYNGRKRRNKQLESWNRSFWDHLRTLCLSTSIINNSVKSLPLRNESLPPKNTDTDRIPQRRLGATFVFVLLSSLNISFATNRSRCQVLPGRKTRLAGWDQIPISRPITGSLLNERNDHALCPRRLY